VDNASVYLLPGVDFLLVFVILGCWIGATVADRSSQQPPPSPSPAGSVDADAEVPPDHRELQPAGRQGGLGLAITSSSPLAAVDSVPP
jgi:hypothetical protein